jgi:predicted dehydrogenase
MPVRLGIVGGAFGASFQWHLHPDCEVVAVCDSAEAGRTRLADLNRTDHVYTDYAEFLSHPGLEAVAVFTPVPLHADMSIQAMRRGKHVISAVPAGMSVEELERLLECVQQTGQAYMMAETSYYRPEIITCREWAQEGRFGTIFYSESEYHHENLLSLMTDPSGNPTWRRGFPPMHYITHCTGALLPVIGERLTEVQAVGWGDDHPILRENDYANPFWSTTAFFKTSGGHCARIAVYWHVAAGDTERAQFYGDRMSYFMARPGGQSQTISQIVQNGVTALDENGYPQGRVETEPYIQPDHLDRLPEPLRVKTGHGNSHTFLTHEFIRALVEERTPAIDIYEAIAYTLPGIVAHTSALRGGETLKIRDYGKAGKGDKTWS